MSKKSMRKYLRSRSFDVTDKPELADAIVARLEHLGLGSAFFIAGRLERERSIWIGSQGTSCYPAAAPVTVHIKHGCELSTLSDLYDIPAKHTISIDGGKEIELSQKSYDNLTEAIK